MPRKSGVKTVLSVFEVTPDVTYSLNVANLFQIGYSHKTARLQIVSGIVAMRKCTTCVC